ncbi:MAG: PIN domain-containing protein [Gemmatimonadota bacterium]|jgi:predicted nucleic acid-binding protein|nr:PIN domain-containing protein [Gemmatimonadota bacterium]
MRLLIDINVALDVILERDPWVTEGALLFSAIQEGRAEGYLAGHTIPTIHYIVRENRRDRGVADAAVTRLLRIFSVVAAENAELLQALAFGFADFEDAVQAACAVKVNADWIVTRNVKDFRKSAIACEPPGAVLAAIQTRAG